MVLTPCCRHSVTVAGHTPPVGPRVGQEGVMLRRFSIWHRLQVCFVCLLFILLGVAAAGLLAVRNMADNLRIRYIDNK